MLKKIYSIFACILISISLNAASVLVVEVHESAFDDAIRLVRKIAPQNDVVNIEKISTDRIRIKIHNPKINGVPDKGNRKEKKP